MNVLLKEEGDNLQAEVEIKESDQLSF